MNLKIRNFFYYGVPVIFWMLFIFTLSSVRGENIPKLPIPHFHMVVHFGEYTVLGFLLIRALTHFVFSVKQEWLAFYAVLFSLLFGLSDEWHQSFVVGRTSQLVTVGYDVIFTVVGVGVYFALRRALSKLKN